jgi:hypothetical protein
MARGTLRFYMEMFLFVAAGFLFPDQRLGLRRLAISSPLHCRHSIARGCCCAIPGCKANARGHAITAGVPTYLGSGATHDASRPRRTGFQSESMPMLPPCGHSHRCC